MEEEYEAAGGEVLLDNDDNDGWLATHGRPKGSTTSRATLQECVVCHIIIWVVLEFSETTKRDDDEDNLPSMDTLEISKGGAIRSIPSYFGGEEEDDIPDMAEYDESENLVESDPVSGCLMVFHLKL